MENYLIYIGKVSLAVGAFYIVFLLLFQNQKHFVFNRFYLPVSLALSFVIPLITFTTVKFVEPTALFDINSFAYLPSSTEVVQLPAFTFEWYHYLFSLYILGAAGFLFHLLLGHLKAILIVKQSWLKTLFQVKVNITKKDVHPFSFFNKIVLSEKTLDNPNLKIIVSHENIHVKENHTFDILFAEILFLFQWFNPFAWLIKDAMKNNLEYKTDQQIAERNNPQAYQLAMVGLADKKGVAPFLTALNGSQLKNRIIMMKKKTENKYAILKQLFVLPLLAILVMGLSNKEIRTEIIQPVNANSALIVDNSFEDFDEDFRSQIFKDGLFFLKDYGENAPLIFLNGERVIEKVILNESEIKSIQVLKEIGAIERFGLDGKNGAMLFNTEKEFEWPNPIQKLAVNVDGKIIQADKPELKQYDTSKGFDSGEIIDALKLNGKVEATTLDFGSGNTTLYIQTADYIVGTNSDFDKVFETNRKAIETKETFYAVNEEIVSKAFFEKYGKDGFESVVILTGNDASEKYGNNYETVVDATIGSANFKIASEKVVKGKVTSENGEPLGGASVVIKGKPMGTITYGNGNYKIEVEKEDKTLIFGFLDIDKKEVSIDNQTEINVQLNTNKKSKEEEPQIRTGNPYDGTLRILNSEGEMAKPMYIVDGEEKESLEDLSPVDFLSMSILKDEAAEQFYGSKGKNGVVQIGTKNWKFPSGSNPLIIVDEKEYNGSIEDIPKDKIFLVRELHYPNFTAKYGEKGKDGVVEIETTKMRKVPSLINYRNKKPDDILWASFGDKTDLNNLEDIKQKEKKQKNNGPVFSKVEEMPEFPGGELALRKFIANNVKYPAIDQESGIQGKVYVSFIIDKEGKVTNSQISRGVDPALDKEALRVINSLPKWKPGKQRGKKVNVSYTVPITFGLQEKVKTEENSTGRNAKSGGDKVTGYGTQKKPTTVDSHVDASKTVFLKNKTGGNEPLYIFDGVEIDSLENVSPSDIESISVLKDKSATELYGEKGKNWVILITSKKAAQNAKWEDVKATGFQTQIKQTTTIKSANNNSTGFDFGSFKDVAPSDPPLYIVDGVETSSIEAINPDNIKSVDVLKNKSATELYGEKGKNGVILVTTNKKEIETVNLKDFLISFELEQNTVKLKGLRGCTFSELTFSANDNQPVFIDPNGVYSSANNLNTTDFLFKIEKIDDLIKLTGKVGTAWVNLDFKPQNEKHFIDERGVSKIKSAEEKPLIVTDGIITDYKSMDDIDPETIKLVNVLKDKKATEKYGDKGKNGVIEITLKSRNEDSKITTQLELRKFIAEKIKYPVEARKNNVQGSTSILVEFDKTGNRIQTMEKSGKKRVNLDEIVVIGYKNNEVENTSKDHQITNHFFGDETIRVINLISKIDIPEFKGQVVAITVKFVLQ